MLDYMSRLGGHAGGQEQWSVSPRGTKFYFYPNSHAKNCIVLTTNTASLSLSPQKLNAVQIKANPTVKDRISKECILEAFADTAGNFSTDLQFAWFGQTFLNAIKSPTKR